MLFPAFRRECGPARQLFDGIPEQFEFILPLPRLRFGINGTLQIPLEMLECQPGRTDEAALERLLDLWLELAELQHGNGSLPALPGKAFVLRLQVGVAGSQKSRRLLARQPAAQGHNDQSVEHARSDELVRSRVQDHLIKRGRIAVENAGHHPMGGLGRGTAKDGVEFFPRSAQESGERSIGRFFAPLAEQMEYEKQRNLRRRAGRLGLIDCREEQRHHCRSICVCGADGINRQALAGGTQLIENLLHLATVCRRETITPDRLIGVIEDNSQTSTHMAHFAIRPRDGQLLIQNGFERRGGLNVPGHLCYCWVPLVPTRHP